MKYFKLWLLALLSVAFLGACSASPESTLERFYWAVSKGELAEAQGYLSREIIQMVPPAKISAGLSKFYEKTKSCGGIKDIVINLQGEGEVRLGVAKLTFNGACKPDDDKVKLIKEDGKWKVSASK